MAVNPIKKKLAKDGKKFFGQPMGIDTGFKRLNESMWGFRPQKLVVIGGRPGQGKSSLLCDMVLAASHEVPVGVFSCEMPSEEFCPRLACNVAGLNFDSVKKGKVTPAEKDKYFMTLKELEDRPIFVDHDNGIVGINDYWLKRRQISVEDTVDSKIKTMVSKHGCKVIFVDYLQLIDYIDLSLRDRRIEVGKIAEILRDYAKQYKITIVLLSQLRRFDQDRYSGDKIPIPTMNDLKESGEIENHSDVIILIHRPAYYNKTEELTFENVIEDDVILIVEKCRDGKDGAIKVDWHGYAMSFRDKENATPNEWLINNA